MSVCLMLCDLRIVFGEFHDCGYLRLTLSKVLRLFSSVAVDLKKDSPGVSFMLNGVVLLFNRSMEVKYVFFKLVLGRQSLRCVG